MLVLTREVDQDVVIGDPANPLGYVRIMAIRGQKVRLGFEFPESIAVHRREVADEILAKSKEEKPS